MKLSDYKGEAALDLLADMIEPAAEIFADKNVAEGLQNGNMMAAIKCAIKNHKKSVIQLLAAIEGEDAESFAEKVTVFTLPSKLLEILNDPEMLRLFGLQGRTGDATSSGSVLENTKE